jgi:citrate lyase subunit beta / citryl-CoA lyase
MKVLRSMLFTPANHARRVEKALGLGADAVILDLEDAVAASEKAAARALAVNALRQPRACLGYVRINALGTEWCYRDVLEVVRPGVDGILLPKVERAADLLAIDWLIGEVEREQGIARGATDLMPIIETGRGLAALDEICRCGSRVRRLTFGAADFTLDMHMQWTREEAELTPARAAIVLASRVAELEPPVDTVWTRLQDRDGLAASARISATLGFQGRMCIHPDQIAIVHEVFTPSEAEYDRARAVVAAFEQAERSGSASIQVDGQFVDYPIVAKARRVVAIMQRINARSEPAPDSRPAPSV